MTADIQRILMEADSVEPDLLFFKNMVAALEAEGGPTTFQQFKSLLKNDRYLGVRKRIMAAFLFRLIFMKRVPEAEAYKIWLQKEPAYKQQFLTDIEAQQRYGENVHLLWDM